MVAAISGINSYRHDPEYLAILRELMAMGIAPSGNKAVDKGKLEHAKLELVQKIQAKQKEEEKEALQVSPLEGVQDTQRGQLEEQRLGAITLAELNKIYFGL